MLFTESLYSYEDTKYSSKVFLIHRTKTKKTIQPDSLTGTPNGIRTHVSALRGRRPRPLDNGGKMAGEQGFEP